MAELNTSDEQRYVFERAIFDEGNIFFTGPPKSGKTKLLRRIISALRLRHTASEIAITASTWAAARNLRSDAVTLHHFAAIHKLSYGAQRIAEFMKGEEKVRLRRTKVLIIDEVNMISAQLFDKIDHILRLARNNDNPFGGIKLIVTGDFFQLSPVPSADDLYPRKAFNSIAWSRTFSRSIKLQRSWLPAPLAAVIDAIRTNTRDAGANEVAEIISQLGHEPTSHIEEPHRYTELFATHATASTTNTGYAQEQHGQAYPAEDSETGWTYSMAVSLDAQPELHLRVGSLVERIESLTYDGKRSKGQVVDFHRNDSGFGPYPLVHFERLPNESALELIEPEQFKIFINSSHRMYLRTQLPLILVRGRIIHEVQGVKLDGVKVRFTGTFSPGQIHTALSRTMDIDSLWVLGLSWNEALADAGTYAFDDSVKTAEEDRSQGSI